MSLARRRSPSGILSLLHRLVPRGGERHQPWTRLVQSGERDSNVRHAHRVRASDAVFLPFAGYVFALGFIGIYVASALYIALFMWWFGRYPPSRGIAVGVVIATVLFLMFEVWFLVPLPKGPIEQLLGY